MRPPFRSVMSFTAHLGVAVGAVEVALRASPIKGHTVLESLSWLGASIGISVAFGCVVGAVAWGIGRRVLGWVEIGRAHV